MNALIDTEYDDPICVDYFRPTRSAITTTIVLLYANSAEHQLHCERASPCDAIACAVFVDRYLRSSRLEMIHIDNFATKNDDLPRNNAGDSVMIAQKKSDAKRTANLSSKSRFNFNRQ